MLIHLSSILAVVYWNGFSFLILSSPSLYQFQSYADYYCRVYSSPCWYFMERWHALPPQYRTGSWVRVLISSFILTRSWEYISLQRNMPAGCKKDNFPTQYKNDLSLFCELGGLDAECESMFLQTEKKKNKPGFKELALILGRNKS